MAVTARRARLLLVTAWAASLALGLVFVFVKAPHPWGWEGFDNYRALGLSLARGETYATLEVPWGYPAFLAVFYRIFGDRQWIPLLVQVALNSLLPLLVYAALRERIGEREALVGALLVGVVSFTTVYASTQTSDSLAAFLFVTATVLLLRARERGGRRWFAASGLAAGVAGQLRPNLLLLPFWFAAIAFALEVVGGRQRDRAGAPIASLGALSVFIGAAVAMMLPWTIRNARLTGRFIPASAHGGIQLWYGSLQVAPFYPNWFDNPRVAFGERVFDASRPDGRSLVISVTEPTGGNCVGIVPQTVAATFWTDRQPSPTRLAPQSWRPGGVAFEVPAQPADTAVYYYFDATWAAPEGTVAQATPVPAALDPLVHFVTTDDFGDADRHGDFIDVFDVVRLVRRDAWHEAVPQGTPQDLDGAVGVMMSDKTKPLAVPVHGLVRSVTSDESAAALTFVDGSTLRVPRNFSGSVLDLDVRGVTASGILHTRRSTRSASLSASVVPAVAARRECFRVVGGIDTVFYRSQPAAQERYTRLAFDNIARTTGAYVVASLRRLLGIFVTAGSDNPSAAHQFSASRVLYEAGRLASVTVFVLFAAGVSIAIARGADVGLLVAAVFYVPVTICPFLTNARYALSAQPFVLGFVAVALVSAYDLAAARGGRTAAGRTGAIT